MPRQTLKERMHAAYLEQAQWVKDCGGDLAGYVRKYHVKYRRTIKDATEIFNADMRALKDLERWA